MKHFSAVCDPNIGYSFMDAMNYCKSLGSYVSLPTQPDLFYEGINKLDVDFNTSTWIGLSKFGNIPDDLAYEIPRASAPFKWDRNKGHWSSDTFINEIEEKNTTSNENCVEISIIDSKLIKNPVSCNKRQSFFICEYSSSNLEETTTFHQHYLDNPGKYHDIDHNYSENVAEKYAEFYVENYKFRYYSEKKSWDDAFETCENEGFYLAEITELSLLDSVRDIMGVKEHYRVRLYRCSLSRVALNKMAVENPKFELSVKIRSLFVALNVVNQMEYLIIKFE